MGEQTRGRSVELGSLMPRRALKLISAVVKASTPKKVKGRVLVRRVAQGTLLAMTIVTARIDTEEVGEKKRLFDSGLIDRLRAPLTRYHE